MPPVFGVLVRSAIFDNETLSSDDIGYSVPDRSGDPECVVSVPNLAAKLDEISAIDYISWKSVRMSQALTLQYISPKTSRS